MCVTQESLEKGVVFQLQSTEEQSKGRRRWNDKKTRTTTATNCPLMWFGSLTFTLCSLFLTAVQERQQSCSTSLVRGSFQVLSQEDSLLSSEWFFSHRFYEFSCRYCVLFVYIVYVVVFVVLSLNPVREDEMIFRLLRDAAFTCLLYPFICLESLCWCVIWVERWLSTTETRNRRCKTKTGKKRKAQRETMYRIILLFFIWSCFPSSSSIHYCYSWFSCSCLPFGLHVDPMTRLNPRASIPTTGLSVTERLQEESKAKNCLRDQRNSDASQDTKHTQHQNILHEHLLAWKRDQKGRTHDIERNRPKKRKEGRLFERRNRQKSKCLSSSTLFSFLFLSFCPFLCVM